jgi:cell division protein ZapA (FtsZ GTPase activity inhibitor)
MSKNKVYLNIRGTEFYITTEDPEDYVRKIEDEVTEAIDGIIGGNPHFSLTMASVLAALNFCDDARKSSASANNLRNQISKYIRDTEKLHSELEEFRHENERMKREIQTLKMRLAESDIPITQDYGYYHQDASKPKPQKGSRIQAGGNLRGASSIEAYDPQAYVVKDPPDLLTLFEAEQHLSNE